jgi:HEAT repeat protein
MLGRARLGEPPRSRTAVLAGFVESAVASLPSRGGTRGRALESLRALALDLQLEQQRVLPLERVLETLDRVRGRREYRLLDMLNALVDARLLTRIGHDEVQFAYAALQAYCSADAIRGASDCRDLVDDVTATLGRLSRLRWWADTLVLLAGMIDDVDALISLILQGAGSGQEERVFLAARCIEENTAGVLSPFLREQTVAALLHLTNVDFEPRIRVRVRAIRSLQRLQESSAIPHLVRIAIEPVRKGWQGARLPEFSSVRLAAVAALRTMGEPALDYVRDELPSLADLLNLWIDGDVPAIARQLLEKDARVGSIAAFLLGLLRRPEAEDRLIEQFVQPNHDRLLSWAIADALTLIDPARVAQEAILPFVRPGSGAFVRLAGESRTGQRDRRRQIAYLIGKVKPQAPWAGRYLDRCIAELTDVALKAYAVRAFGDLLEIGRKGLLERLAIGDFSGVATGRRWSDADRLWLRLAAVETLAELGDTETAQRLRRERRTDQPWTPELELALYRTSEEIAARAWEGAGC